MYKPYDYVLSKDVVGSFRAYTDTGDVAFRPIYRRVSGKWAKLTSRAAAAMRGRRHLLLDRDCVLAREEDVTLLASWRNREVDPDGPTAHDYPSALRELLSELRSRQARIHLYGSRLLSNRSKPSDWDFILDYPGDPIELLRGCVGRHAFLDPQEISSIADFYEVTTTGLISREDTIRIVGRSWCAVRLAGTIVDFFLVGGEGGRIPDVHPDRLPLTDIEGVIESSAGSSFHMPRTVRIHTSTGRQVNVHHVSWILTGLERMSGSRIALRDVVTHGRSDAWLSPWISQILL